MQVGNGSQSTTSAVIFPLRKPPFPVMSDTCRKNNRLHPRIWLNHLQHRRIVLCLLHLTSVQTTRPYMLRLRSVCATVTDLGTFQRVAVPLVYMGQSKIHPSRDMDSGTAFASRVHLLTK